MRYLRDTVTLTIEDDFVRAIEGSGLDADMLRSYFESWREMAFAAVVQSPHSCSDQAAVLGKL